MTRDGVGVPGEREGQDQHQPDHDGDVERQREDRVAAGVGALGAPSPPPGEQGPDDRAEHVAEDREAGCGPLVLRSAVAALGGGASTSVTARHADTSHGPRAGFRTIGTGSSARSPPRSLGTAAGRRLDGGQIGGGLSRWDRGLVDRGAAATGVPTSLPGVRAEQAVPALDPHARRLPPLRAARSSGCPGQWLGSWFLNICLAQVLVIGIVLGGAIAAYPDPPLLLLGLVGGAVTVLFPIWFFPYSRMIWVAIDLAMRPLEWTEGVDPQWELGADADALARERAAAAAPPRRRRWRGRRRRPGPTADPPDGSTDPTDAPDRARADRRGRTAPSRGRRL